MSSHGDYKPEYWCPPWSIVMKWLDDKGYRLGRMEPGAVLYYNPRAAGAPLLLYVDLGGRIEYNPRGTGLCAATPWGTNITGWAIVFKPEEAGKQARRILELLEEARPRIVVLALHLAPGHCYSVRSVAGWTPLVLAQDGVENACSRLKPGAGGSLAGF